jgi:WD repeat-containing protein 35
VAIAAAGEHCVIATRLEDASGQNALVLYNAIGTPIDSKYVDIEPIAVTMTTSLVIAASREQFFAWQYRTPKAKSSLEIGLGRSEARRERTFHVDDHPSGYNDPLAEAQRNMGGAVSSALPDCSAWTMDTKIENLLRDFGVSGMNGS